MMNMMMIVMMHLCFQWRLLWIKLLMMCGFIGSLLRVHLVFNFMWFFLFTLNIKWGGITQTWWMAALFLECFAILLLSGTIMISYLYLLCISKCWILVWGHSFWVTKEIFLWVLIWVFTKVWSVTMRRWFRSFLSVWYLWVESSDNMPRVLTLVPLLLAKIVLIFISSWRKIRRVETVVIVILY